MNPIGVQLFSLPFLLEKNFEQAIAMLSDMGYQEIELFGPYPYSTPPAKQGWAAVTPQLGFEGSGYFGLSDHEVAALLKAHDIRVPAIHTDLHTLETRMEEFAKAREVLGFTYVILPMIPETERTSIDAYLKMADRFNTIGAKAAQLGLKFAYHNHGYGLQEVNGVIPFQTILDQTDPELVFFELDLFWTTAGKANPVHYLEQNPDRFRLLHIKDMKTKVHFSGDGGTDTQWIELFPHMTTAGDGVLDLKKILSTAKICGTQHFIVEQDMAAAPKIALKRSIDYLKKYI